MQARRRLFSCPQGIEIGTTREYQPVYIVERINDNVYTIDGRNEHGSTACINHLAIITFHKHDTTVAKVGSQPDDGLAFGLRKRGVYVLQAGLQVEVLHSFWVRLVRGW